jgi:hypothetical protein
VASSRGPLQYITTNSVSLKCQILFSATNNQQAQCKQMTKKFYDS